MRKKLLELSGCNEKPNGEMIKLPPIEFNPLLKARENLGLAKRLLIQELVHIFRLRKVSKKVLNQVNLEYRIVSVGLPALSSIQTLKQSHIYKLNACVEYMARMLILLSHYLEIILPFPIECEKGKLYCKTELDSDKVALFYEDNSDFIIGLSALGFNIAYLCASQGIIIQLENTVNLIEMLALLCEHQGLGNTKSDLLNYDLSDVIYTFTSRQNTIVANDDEAWAFID